MKLFRQKRMVWRAVLGLILLMILLWGADLAWNSYRLWRIIQQGQSLAAQGWQNVALEQIADLGEQAYPHLAAVRRDVRPLYPLLTLAQGLPRFGPYVGQIEPGLESGTDLLRAGVALVPVLEPIYTDKALPGGLTRLERLVQVIEQQAERVSVAQAAIERGVPYLQRLNPEGVPTDLRDNLFKLKESSSLLLATARLLPDLPGLLGAGKPQTYLVLGQNNDELRATGGFISAMGVITMDAGRVAAFNLPDSYSVDNFAAGYPPPPEPLEHYMLAGVWVPRDANWSPDFPTAALQAQALYTLSNGIAVDGVVAFDQAAIQALVAAMGQVAVAGYAEPLIGANVAFAMRSAWNPGEGQAANNQWYANRKNFMSDMGQAILGELLAMRSPEQVQAVLNSLIDSLRAGHLQVYFNDAAAQAQLASLGLDGSIHPGPADFLMLVDWNFGFNKVDPLIQRELDYQLDLSNPQQPVATLSVRYTHTLQEPVTCRHEAAYGQTYEDLQRRCFWNYWRVYAPPGARLLAVQAPPLPGTYLLNQTDWDGRLDVSTAEGGAQVFGGPLMLPAAGQAEIVLRYQLPAGLLQAESGALVYRLRLQKQAGLLGLPVRVRVIPPQGYRAEALGSTWWQAAGAVQWQATLGRTQELGLRFVLQK